MSKYADNNGLLNMRSTLCRFFEVCKCRKSKSIIISLLDSKGASWDFEYLKHQPDSVNIFISNGVSATEIVCNNINNEYGIENIIGLFSLINATFPIRFKENAEAFGNINKPLRVD